MIESGRDGNGEIMHRHLDPPSFASLPDVAHGCIASVLPDGTEKKGNRLRVSEASRALLESYGGSLTRACLRFTKDHTAARLAALLRRQNKLTSDAEHAHTHAHASSSHSSHTEHAYSSDSDSDDSHSSDSDSEHDHAHAHTDPASSSHDEKVVDPIDDTPSENSTNKTNKKRRRRKTGYERCITCDPNGRETNACEEDCGGTERQKCEVCGVQAAPGKNVCHKATCGGTPQFPLCVKCGKKQAQHPFVDKQEALPALSLAIAQGCCCAIESLCLRMDHAEVTRERLDIVTGALEVEAALPALRNLTIFSAKTPGVPSMLARALGTGSAPALQLFSVHFATSDDEDLTPLADMVEARARIAGCHKLKTFVVNWGWLDRGTLMTRIRLLHALLPSLQRLDYFTSSSFT